jgi:pyridoxal phosphate enzyme (YggS family)
MTTIAANLQAVRARIAAAAKNAGRSADDIVLVAVSKSFGPEAVAEAHAAGQRVFGESRAQEAVMKLTELARLPLEWHFVGPIQANKTRLIAEHFDWVHGLARERVALRLNEARPAGLAPLQVCLQVNVSGEGGKSGVAPGEEVDLARAVARLPRLRLRGLMAIPEPTADVALRRRRFALLRELKDALAARGYALDTLSMGMSDDFEAAIAEGATMVRIGTAIFGQRQTS